MSVIFLFINKLGLSFFVGVCYNYTAGPMRLCGQRVSDLFSAVLWR